MAKKNQGMFRQGDVLVIPMEGKKLNRKGAKLVKREAGRIVLAHGEATGHAHAIANQEAQLWQQADGTRVLQVHAPVRLRHEEHSELRIAKGTYEIRRQREHIAGELPRNVAD